MILVTPGQISTAWALMSAAPISSVAATNRSESGVSWTKTSASEWKGSSRTLANMCGSRRSFFCRPDNVGTCLDPSPALCYLVTETERASSEAKVQRPGCDDSHTTRMQMDDLKHTLSMVAGDDVDN
ncbi:hypothetical protein RJ639_021625 [Escallonia herrerae]|uniref:Uncharacterized protein n=1 Tax=Escallonia herrerae TaxID=1293975 RepID=A0AA88V3W4_9ASTE|nr:hypothetical protein RJ639_021625 [Escallonia herrerae]